MCHVHILCGMIKQCGCHHFVTFMTALIIELKIEIFQTQIQKRLTETEGTEHQPFSQFILLIQEITLI